MEGASSALPVLVGVQDPSQVQDPPIWSPARIEVLCEHHQRQLHRGELMQQPDEFLEVSAELLERQDDDEAQLVPAGRQQHLLDARSGVSRLGDHVGEAADRTLLPFTASDLQIQPFEPPLAALRVRAPGVCRDHAHTLNAQGGFR